MLRRSDEPVRTEKEREASSAPEASSVDALPPAQVLSRQELIEQGIPLVRRMAFRFARRLPPNVCVEDLIGAGTEGLLRAVEGYDPARQPNFLVFAAQRVRGAMLDELRAADPMTRYGRKRLVEASRVIRQLEQDLGRAPDETEIAKALGISIEAYHKMMEEFSNGPALARLGEVDPDEVAGNFADPGQALDEQEMKQRLISALQRLPERSQTVLALYYQEECTQAEIGKILGVTESRVCQLLGEATARLRASFTDIAPKTSRKRSD